MRLYREWQRAHPEWPVRLGDVEGRQVQLRRDITTVHGITHYAKTIFTILSTHRGRLHIQAYGAEPGQGWIRGVGCNDVELLPLMSIGGQS